ncbi:hypothetical protein M427DRAFT_50665 [Gonapodya prolifera JEL478]|uniref:Integrase core domain-containing protein n=1 Tax=Gonapodya prolifera (strain JEL478) TaxID=1344416 RepID=A0A139B064_GONPJ|nr:hypothetical protein M427DRAFT_50665 [Gonapodya prolifera JEL478]|eukprot:KXS22330.1 hypothetical protein M427DRAFT_50665 [Gonapodya prolifera JEL478]
MKTKSPVWIYEHGFRPAVLRLGLWDNIRAGKGTEACLVSFVQILLAPLRCHQDRDPVHLVPSVHNTPMERPWKEANERISAPLRRQLDHMRHSHLFSMDNEMHRFCISEVTLRVVRWRIDNHLTIMRFCRVPGRRDGNSNGKLSGNDSRPATGCVDNRSGNADVSGGR